MDHFMTPKYDLQEIPLGNAEFSWFPDGSYLKEDNDKYCSGYAIATPFVVFEAVPMATSAPKSELCDLTQACTLLTFKTARIYTDSR